MHPIWSSVEIRTKRTKSDSAGNMGSSWPSAKELFVGQLVCIAEADSQINVMWCWMLMLTLSMTLKRWNVPKSDFIRQILARFLRTVSSSELYGTISGKIKIDLSLFSPHKIKSISVKLLSFCYLSSARRGTLFHFRHPPIIWLKHNFSLPLSLWQFLISLKSSLKFNGLIVSDLRLQCVQGAIRTNVIETKIRPKIENYSQLEGNFWYCTRYSISITMALKTLTSTESVLINWREMIDLWQERNHFSTPRRRVQLHETPSLLKRYGR